MKTFLKLFTLCTFTTFTLESFGQETFTSYENNYNDKTYEIQISAKEKDKFTLYIDAMSLDKLHEKGGIMIKEKQHKDFLNALTEAKGKYVEWVKTAKENNIKEVDKTMNIKSKVDGFFRYGDWNFDYNVNLKFDFKILESKDKIKYLLLVRTGELESSSNQFMKVDGFVLVFTSETEIENFASQISLQKINDFAAKPKAETLFKD
jgi:hypothetical protein